MRISRLLTCVSLASSGVLNGIATETTPAVPTANGEAETFTSLLEKMDDSAILDLLYGLPVTQLSSEDVADLALVHMRYSVQKYQLEFGRFAANDADKPKFLPSVVMREKESLEKTMAKAFRTINCSGKESDVPPHLKEGVVRPSALQSQYEQVKKFVTNALEGLKSETNSAHRRQQTSNVIYGAIVILSRPYLSGLFSQDVADYYAMIERLPKPEVIANEAIADQVRGCMF